MSKRSTVVGFAAIIVLMSAAAAQGLAGENTVDSGDIIDGTVKHADIKENTIGSSRMLDNSVHSVKISDGSIIAIDMADNAVTEPKIADNAVTNPQIADNAVNSANIVADGVTGADTAGSGQHAHNFPSIGVGICLSTNLVSAPIGGGYGDDAAVVTASSAWPNGLSLHTENSGTLLGASSVSLVACNVTNAAIDPPDTTFDYVLIDS